MLFNLIPLIFVLAFMGIGSKKGFIREVMGFVGLCAAIIITTGKLDFIAIELANAVEASPLTIAILAFVIVLALTFAVFKLLAKLLARLIDVQKLGKRDQYGGAVIGALRGWLVAGTVLFVSVLLPLPRAYYGMVDQSMLATSAMRSVQLLYDATGTLHPEWPGFVAQVENTLTSSATELAQQDQARKPSRRKPPEKRVQDEVKLREALHKVYFYFADGEEF
ncbi:MAG: CvpA family protein [bacterium]